MANEFSIVVFSTQRDGSKLQVSGALGSSLASDVRVTFDLFYKIGVTGTYTALDISGKNISIAQWSYSFDVGTNESVYLRYRGISTLIGEFGEDVVYTGVTTEIPSVLYNKKKTARSTKAKKSVATQNTTRKEIPNI